MSTRETRAAFELRADGGSTRRPRLVGYAAVFDSPSKDLGGFTEIVKPGAFRRSLGSQSQDQLALVHHIPHLVLGRRSAGTLRLQEDSRGLHFEVDMPDTQAARDLLVSIERRDVQGASFAFSVPKGGDRWERRGEKSVRELLDVDLHEITLTPTPAYPETSVARRALAALVAFPRVAIARRYLETV